MGSLKAMAMARCLLVAVLVAGALCQDTMFEDPAPKALAAESQATLEAAEKEASSDVKAKPASRRDEVASPKGLASAEAGEGTAAKKLNAVQSTAEGQLKRQVESLRAEEESRESPSMCSESE